RVTSTASSGRATATAFARPSRSVRPISTSSTISSPVADSPPSSKEPSRPPRVRAGDGKPGDRIQLRSPPASPLVDGSSGPHLDIDRAGRSERGAGRPARTPVARRHLAPGPGSPGLRPCQRGRDGPDPRLLPDPLGVRAPHVPDSLEPRRNGRRELLARLLAAGPGAVPRDDDPSPEARPEE